MRNKISKLVIEEITVQLNNKVTVSEDQLIKEDLSIPSLKLIMLLNKIIAELKISLMDFSDYEIINLKTVKDLIDLLVSKKQQ